MCPSPDKTKEKYSDNDKAHRPLSLQIGKEQKDKDDNKNNPEGWIFSNGDGRPEGKRDRCRKKRPFVHKCDPLTILL